VSGGRCRQHRVCGQVFYNRWHSDRVNAARYKTSVRQGFSGVMGRRQARVYKSYAGHGW